MPQPVVGCDLSRAHIDTCRLPSGTVERIANTPQAIAAFVDSLERDALVVFEATSGCDGELMAVLAERSHRFSRVNPRQAREFARLTQTAASGRPDKRERRELLRLVRGKDAK